MTWETVPFSAAFLDITAKSPRVKRSEFAASGKFPVRDQGEQDVAGYWDDVSAVTRVDRPLILFGDHTRRVKFASEDFVIGADGVKVLATSPGLEPRFAFHWMSALKIPSAGYSRHFKFLQQHHIPLPPLPEQRRIAAILDEADALRTKVKRIPQLNRDFEDAYFLRSFGDPRSVAARPLLEMVHAQSGGTPSKVKPEYWAGTIPWVSPKDMKTRNLFDAIDHISDTAVEQTTLRLLPPDTVAIVVRGMILVHTIPVARLRVASTINQDMKALIPKESIDPAFLAAAIRLQSNSILGAVSVAGHGTRRLDAEALQAIRVPIATLDQQTAFGATVATAEQMGASMSASARALDTLFASLQHRAFRGEL